MYGGAPHVPVAALERLAEADAFGALGLDRRQALWAIRGLSDARLPLFDAPPVSWPGLARPPTSLRAPAEKTWVAGPSPAMTQGVRCPA